MFISLFILCFWLSPSKNNFGLVVYLFDITYESIKRISGPVDVFHNLCIVWVTVDAEKESTGVFDEILDENAMGRGMDGLGHWP